MYVVCMYVCVYIYTGFFSIIVRMICRWARDLHKGELRVTRMNKGELRVT